MCFLFFCCDCFAQADVDSLHWHRDRRLTWNDFTGEPDDEPIFGARTFTSIKYKLLDRDTACNVQVRCIFLKKVSWTQPQHATEYALLHEQIHFDISELFARKLRQAYCRYKYNRQTVNADVAEIFSRICAEKTKFNRQYDKETCHSLHKMKQLEWTNKISDMLDQLSEFESR